MSNTWLMYGGLFVPFETFNISYELAQISEGTQTIEHMQNGINESETFSTKSILQETEIKC